MPDVQYNKGTINLNKQQRVPIQEQKQPLGQHLSSKITIVDRESGAKRGLEIERRSITVL